MTAGTLPRIRPAALAAVRSPVFMGVAAAAAIAVLVRAPFFFWPLISDEGGYAYTAYWWFRGLTLYSDELWFDKPQGIFVVYKLGSLLFGDATWAIRLWGALWAAGTTVAVWLVARRLLDRHAAVVAALLYAVFSAHTHIEGFTANAETFMVLPATLSAYFLLRGQPLTAGLMASAAVVLKPSGGSAVLLGVVWFAYLRADRGAWLRFLLAGLSLPLVSVLHGALTAGPREYLDAVVLQRINTPRPNPFVAARRVWLATLPLWAPLALLARFGIPRLMRRERVFLLLWLASALAGMALGGNWWEHYFIQLMPPLTVAAAPGLVYLWRSTVVRRWTAIALLLAPVYVAAAFVRPGPELGSWVLFRRDAYLVAEDAAAYIRERTAADERIYVSFAEADIYHLARRRSATQYLYGQLFLAFPDAYERTLSGIEAGEPRYVLLVREPPQSVDPDGRFLLALARRYELEREFGGQFELEEFEPVRLYRRR